MLDALMHGDPVQCQVFGLIQDLGIVLGTLFNVKLWGPK